MKTKTVLSKVTVITVLALGCVALAFSHGQRQQSLAGTWINTFDFPGDPNSLLQSQVLLPLDPAGTRFAAIVDSPNPVQNTADHTFGRPTGTYVRVGPNQYKFTLMYGRAVGPTAFPGRATLATLHVFSGTAYLSDENTLVNVGTLAVFSASQDVAPRDGFPDAGEVPATVFPWTYVSKRVVVQEPYPLP